MNGKVRLEKVRLENTANSIERCIHCGAELKTQQELNDQVCDSCATALTCDEGDCVKELKSDSHR